MEKLSCDYEKNEDYIIDILKDEQERIINYFNSMNDFNIKHEFNKFVAARDFLEKLKL